MSDDGFRKGSKANEVFISEAQYPGVNTNSLLLFGRIYNLDTKLKEPAETKNVNPRIKINFLLRSMKKKSTVNSTSGYDKRHENQSEMFKVIKSFVS